MSKAARKLSSKKLPDQKVESFGLKNVFNTTILAQCATAAPPLGPLLGRFGINIGNFCQTFNEKTKEMKRGIPIPVSVKVRPDRTYDIHLHTPSLTYYLMQAAGIRRGALRDEKLAGKITLKHAYEIAKIKHTDPYSKYQIYDLKNVVKNVVGVAKSMGIVVVRDLNPQEYEEFLNKRNTFLEERQKELEEKMKLKLQRL